MLTTTLKPERKFRWLSKCVREKRYTIPTDYQAADDEYRPDERVRIATSGYTNSPAITLFLCLHYFSILL